MPARAFWIEPKKHTIAANAKRCAEAIGMVPSTFANYAADGIVAPRKDGKWDTRAVCKALAAHDQAKAATKVPEPRTSEALERGRQARAELLEVELATLRGTLVERDSVHCALGEVVAIHKAGLMALPKQGAVELANQTPAFIEDWLDRWARRFGGTMQETWDRLPFLAAAKPGPKAGEQRPAEPIGTKKAKKAAGR